jgi:DNA polymerase-4
MSFWEGPPTALRWLYIDFNSYFASVEQQLDERLRDKPVAVVPTNTDATSVIAASYEAKHFGIKTGTPVWEAKKLCPDLICVVAKHDQYVAYHNRIIEEVNRHTPVTQVCSIDEVACRMMSNELDLDYITALAARIKVGLAQHVGAYIKCSIGVSTNKYLAKIATDMQKPDGYTVLQQNDLPDKLYALKLNDFMGIGRRMEVRINQAGVYDVRTLMQMSAPQLKGLWGGIWGERMWYYLRGYEVPEVPTQKSNVGHSHVLAPESRPVTKAYIIAQRLTLKAASRLRRMNYCAKLFALSVRFENGQRFAMDIKSKPIQDNFSFYQLLDALWIRALKEVPNSNVKKISVNLHGLIPQKDVGVQLNLFDNQDAQVKEAVQLQSKNKLSAVMDVLNQKYGKDTVLMGLTPGQGKAFTGTKVAFTRIPEQEEFFE